MQTLFRHIVSTFRSGALPRNVALGVLLGLAAGLLTGWNLTLPLVVAAALLLGVHGPTFVAAWVAGAMAGWLLETVCWHLGRLVLDSTPLGSAVAALGDGPMTALLGWDCYTVVGGAALAVAIGLPLAHLARRTVVGAGTTIDAAGQRWLRPWGWIPAAALLSGTLALPGLVGSDVAARRLIELFDEANGGKVDCARLEVDYRTGEVKVEDLRLPDPGRTGGERLRVGRATLKVHVGQLLRGRLHADSVLLEEVELGRRHEPADRTRSGPTVLTEAAGGTDRVVELNDFLADWSGFAERLGLLKELVVAAERLPSLDEVEATADRFRRRSGSGATRARRSSLGSAEPRIAIRRLRVEQLPSDWELGQKATLTWENLSSKQQGDEAPSRLEIVVPRLAARVTAKLHLGDRHASHQVQVQAFDLRLREMVDAGDAAGYVQLGRGRLSIEGQGWATARQLEVKLEIEARDLEANVVRPEGLVGLDARLWNEGLRRLARFRATALLEGSWESPRVTVEPQAVVAQLKHQLRAAGEHVLVEAIAEQSRAAAAAAEVAQAQRSWSAAASAGRGSELPVEPSLAIDLSTAALPPTPSIPLPSLPPLGAAGAMRSVAGGAARNTPVGAAQAVDAAVVARQAEAAGRWAEGAAMHEQAGQAAQASGSSQPVHQVQRPNGSAVATGEAAGLGQTAAAAAETAHGQRPPGPINLVLGIDDQRSAAGHWAYGDVPAAPQAADQAAGRMPQTTDPLYQRPTYPLSQYDPSATAAALAGGQVSQPPRESGLRRFSQGVKQTFARLIPGRREPAAPEVAEARRPPEPHAAGVPQQAMRPQAPPMEGGSPGQEPWYRRIMR